MPPPLFKILGGVCKGLSLHLPPKQITRPTKAIVRESFFNVLQTSIIHSVFIEAFAGSASMGLEALSRGASQAYLFEQDPHVFFILQQNIQAFKNRLKEAQIQAICTDVFTLLQTCLETLKSEGLVILYMDPPFMEGIYTRCVHFLESLTIPSSLLEHGFLIVFEHESLQSMPRNIAGFSIIKQRKFGKTSLSYYFLSKE
ncbi:16S rRNA (guanine(966)-N(2))-methyltransferase RsmD [Helicobacter suis]|uniref:16S rRNA (guanine(966)-N(2))-methyltransferase RsmD n=1 Tax=Helicobacter suis TaxID=104628 RepID=UPI0013D86383|nr:16S rRNA (guanine(966)-N(2))-methyltransferase RsmD [Helicobacter suis]